MGDAADDLLRMMDEYEGHRSAGFSRWLAFSTSARDDFSQPTEEQTMTTIRETAEAQLQRNELERQRLLTRLALLDRFGPEDPWEDDAVISFQRTFGGPRTYTHIAIKLGGVWYVTGSRNATRSFAWDELVEEHLAKAIPETIFVVSDWVKYEDVD